MTLEVAELDIIANFIGLDEQNEHASGKVLESAAQRHTNGNAGRSKNRDKRTCLNSQDADNHDD